MWVDTGESLALGRETQNILKIKELAKKAKHKILE